MPELAKAQRAKRAPLCGKMKRKLESAGSDSVAGSYVPNHFLIELTNQTPFINDSDTTDMEHFPVFMHEYWHYLHNITTISGFRAFVLAQLLVPRFASTLVGRESLKRLDIASAEYVATLLKLFYLRDGVAGPKNPWARDPRSFTATKIVEGNEPFAIGGRASVEPFVSIGVKGTAQNGRIYGGEFKFGSLAIEESVAWMVQDKISSVKMPLHMQPPLFPYATAGRVLNLMLPGRDLTSTFYPAALGTLSLLHTSPGTAFISFGRDFAKALASGASEDAALDGVIGASRARIQLRIDAARGDLVNLESMLKDRGSWGQSVAFVCDLIRKGFDSRVQDPVFDVRAAFDPTDQNNLATLREKFPPCDILQQEADDGKRLYAFNRSATEPMRILQAQQHYMFSHISSRNSFIPSTRVIKDPPPRAAIERECPFLDACPLPFFQDNPEVCWTNPWRACEDADSHCWYSVAVLETIGGVKIQRK